MDKYIFKREASAYTPMSDPISAYFEQTSTYLSKKNGLSKAENKALTKRVLAKNNISNPLVKYHYTNDVGDKEIREDRLTDYFKDVKANNEIMAPSLTTYLHPEVKKSVHASFLDVNIGKRKSDKHNAFKYKQLGDVDRFMYFNTLQKTRKVFNNSLSGAYASKSTILYNPSAHYTLTSMTRSVTSIGNSITESLVAGNKHFKDPEVTINYITAIITKTNMDNVKATVDKYNIYTPTPKNVMDSIIYSSRIYWEDPIKEKEILEYLEILTPYELASVLYNNDMFHMKMYNDQLVRDLLGGMCDRTPREIADPLAIMGSLPEGIANMVHHTLSVELMGMTVNYKELDPKLMNIVASTALTAMDTLVKFSDLIHTFLVTDIMPPTIAYIKDMLRDSIVLSDTDSTCGSYDQWVKWYFGDIIFTPDAMALSAAVMTINTQVIDHYLKIFSYNMNIHKDGIEQIKMKNEFYWDVFTSTNVSKHYFANVRVQEGNVFDEPDLELKGVHLIASKANKAIRDMGYAMIKDIHKTVTSGGKLSLADMGKQVADMERWVIGEIKKGSVEIFNLDKIKEESAYKLEAVKSPYFHHMLWEEVFSAKYGSPGEPTYMVVTVPTKLTSNRKTTEFLSKIEDPEIKEKLTNFLTKHKKEMVGTFRIPLVIAGGNGLPDEIFNAIDIHRVVTTSLNILYLILSSVRLYRKENLLLSEMGY